MLLAEAEMLSKLPLNTIKFHQLQLIRGTAMVTDCERNPQHCKFYELDEYTDLTIRFIERLNPKFVIERFFSEAPSADNATPIQRNLRNDQMLKRLEQTLAEQDTWKILTYR